MPFTFSIHKLTEPKGNVWKSIVALLNIPLKRQGLNGEEIIDPNLRVRMVGSIPFILGGSDVVVVSLFVLFALLIR